MVDVLEPMFQIKRVAKSGRIYGPVLAQGTSPKEAWFNFNRNRCWGGFSERSQFDCFDSNGKSCPVVVEDEEEIQFDEKGRAIIQNKYQLFEYCEDGSEYDADTHWILSEVVDEGYYKFPIAIEELGWTHLGLAHRVTEI